MALDQTANFVRGSTSESVTNSQTTIGVNDANTYPDPTNGHYNLVLWDADNHPRPDQDPDVEIVRVTGRDTTNNTITVSRGQESTTAVSHPSGSALHLSPTSAFFADVASESQLGVTHVQTTEPAYSEGHTWVDPNTGIYRAAYDAGGGGDFHPVPPIRITQEASTFDESDLTVTHNKTTENGSHIELGATVNPYTISSATFNNSYSVAGETAFQSNLAWNSDGSKLYVIGYSTDSIHSYSLSTNYDISTASYLNSKDVSTEDGIPAGLAWNGDGSKLYVVGANNDTVYSYSASTAYDITTASLLNSFSVGTESASPYGVAWNGNGSKLYICGNSNNAIYSYSLSTAYDISTASYLNTLDISGTSTDPWGMVFNDTGSKMYVAGSSEAAIYSFNLSTAYDITTAAHNDTFDTSSQDGSVMDIEWNGDGSKFYLLGYNTDTVYSYIPESGVKSGDVALEFTDPSDIQSWDLATFQRTLDNETVDVYVAESSDGGSTWSRINSGNPITRNFDISTISASNDVRIEVELSRSNTSNNPTLDYAARRYVR